MRMLSIKMRKLKGLKNDILHQESWGFLQPTKQLPSEVYKKGAVNYFKKFLGKLLGRSLGLLKLQV